MGRITISTCDYCGKTDEEESGHNIRWLKVGSFDALWSRDRNYAVTGFPEQTAWVFCSADCMCRHKSFVCDHYEGNSLARGCTLWQGHEGLHKDPKGSEFVSIIDRRRATEASHG